MTDTGIEVPRRGPGRPKMHPDPRPDVRSDSARDDSLARAEARAREIMDHGGLPDDAADKFAISDGVPDGWDYQWKRKSIFGKEDPAYDVQLARGGWEAVPASRHPDMMPRDGGHQTIERDGMILMERPKIVTDRARMNDLAKARNQVRAKEAQIAGTPEGTLKRTSPAIGKSMEHVPLDVPSE